jgi:hypothetical protein
MNVAKSSSTESMTVDSVLQEIELNTSQNLKKSERKKVNIIQRHLLDNRKFNSKLPISKMRVRLNDEDTLKQLELY